MMNKSPHILFGVIFMLNSCCACSQAETGVPGINGITGFLDSLSFHSEKKFIFIDKSNYRLYLMMDTIVLKDYPVVFGFNPVDDKLKEGDGCTPEGVFKIQSQYPHQSWNKFLWIDYPNASSWQKHKDALRSGKIPEGSAIGGEIGIHGVAENADDLISNKTNWTWGCISLKNEDINELYKEVAKGTYVIIRK